MPCLSAEHGGAEAPRPALDVVVVRMDQPQVLGVGGVEVLKPEYYRCP